MTPEFLNRLDEIVRFSRLSRDHMDAIVAIQIAALQDLLADRNIELELDDHAIDWLAMEGYDPVYGARPLKRVIQRALQNALATKLLAGAIKSGDQVRVSAGDGGLTIDGEHLVAA